MAGAISVSRAAKEGSAKRTQSWGVGHDEGNVVRPQAGVHRVADRAHAGDAIIEFKMTEIVPGESRYAIP